MNFGHYFTFVCNLYLVGWVSFYFHGSSYLVYFDIIWLFWSEQTKWQQGFLPVRTYKDENFHYVPTHIMCPNCPNYFERWGRWKRSWYMIANLSVCPHKLDWMEYELLNWGTYWRAFSFTFLWQSNLRLNCTNHERLIGLTFGCKNGAVTKQIWIRLGSSKAGSDILQLPVRIGYSGSMLKRKKGVLLIKPILTSTSCFKNMKLMYK
jgi:hypothetical protein